MTVRRGAIRVLTGVLVGWAVLAHATESAAQRRSAPPVRPPRVEAGGGIGWVGQSDVGTRNATLTSNATGEDPDPFTFFRVVGRTRSGVVGSGWLGVNLTQAMGVEAAFHYSRPSLRAVINDDVEEAPDTTIIAEAFTQTLVEGNFLYHFNQARFDNGHTVPFVLAGAGSFRQRQQNEGVTQTGAIYQAGVGFKWTSRIDRLRHAKGLGVRVDVRYVLRDGGFDFSDDARRSFIAASATTSFAF